MTEFFHLLHQKCEINIVLLQKSKKKIPHQFLLPASEAHKSIKFHQQLGTVAGKMRDWGVVGLRHQYRNA